MIHVQLDLEPSREPVYREALARLRGVALTGSPGDVLITSGASPGPVPTLLDQPETSTAEALADLVSSRVMPGHQWRFSPAVLPVRESLERGQLGKPGLFRAHHWSGNKSAAPTPLALRQIDLAQWFFGTTPSRVHTLTRENYLQVHLGFPDDGMALIDVATNRPGAQDYHSMHLIGADGAAYADDHRNAHLLFSPAETQALVHPENELLAVQAMLTEFIDGIRQDRDWSVTPQDTVNAHATLTGNAHA